MKKITFGTRELNQLLDDTLMKKHLFPSETLMEIAGLAVAQVAHLILRRDSGQQQGQQQKQSICVLVGPGNNGGDGLVAARHLRMMNYIVDLVVFKQLEGKNGIYHQLCTLNDIPSRTPTSFLSEKNSPAPLFRHHLQESTLIIDSVFGFPFTGEMRQPYREFIHELKDFEGKILSVDIPSGWDANEGNIHNLFTPRYLISLGLPKKCSEDFKG
jgi:NAD(P)H-hydrate epimerase